jgi:hypothetical protein
MGTGREGREHSEEPAHCESKDYESNDEEEDIPSEEMLQECQPALAGEEEPWFFIETTEELAPLAPDHLERCEGEEMEGEE